MRKQHGMRRSPRLPLGARVRVTWQDERGDPKVANGRCSDISETGLGVELDEPIPLRSYVQFRIKDIKFEGSGSVRYLGWCRMKRHVGLEFSGTLRWTGSTSPVEPACVSG